MLGFTLAQMRLSLPRLIAGGLAISIGSAFVAATLLSGTVMRETVRNAVTAQYAGADLVITDPLSDKQLDALRTVPGVAVAAGRQDAGGELTGSRGAAYVPIGSLMSDPRLEPQKLVSGSWPGADQLSLPVDVAERLGVTVGSPVREELTRYLIDPQKPNKQKTQTKQISLTVSGLTRDPSGAFGSTDGLALVPLAAARTWNAYQQPGEQPAYSLTLVLVRPGSDVATVQQAMTGKLRDLGQVDGPYGKTFPVAQVQTLTQQADESVARLTGDSAIVLVVLLAFAAIAMLVAALVIANTFQVLVAQRTQTLALLRCIGALKQQLRRSVVTEALLVGLGASAIGVLGGSVLAQVTLLTLRRLQVAEQLPGSVRMNWLAIVLPIVVGTVVTLIASLAPARAATRVAPLAALRPDAGPTLRERSSKVRLAFAACLVLGGALLLAAGLAGSIVFDQAAPALLVGVLGGGLSFVGLLLGAVFWMPRLTGLLGRLIAAGGAPSAKLAAANGGRNPRRTAATAGALLIGVTLVSLMTTGAASARASLGNELDASMPVDISVGYESPQRNAPLSAEQLDAIRKVDGVTAVEPVTTATVEARFAKVGEAADPSVGADGIDPAAGARVLRSRDVAQALKQGKVLASPDLWSADGNGPTFVQLRSAGGEWRSVRVAYLLGGARGTIIMPASLLATLAPHAVASQAWVGVDRESKAAAISNDVSDALGTVSGATIPPVNSAVVVRESYDRAIDGALAVVLGLLGISVVIALVGVANTLSLSVLERRRESATLRTIGLTQRQLRWTLAVEGMTVAAVGAISGIALGVVYGCVGTGIALGGGSLGSQSLRLVLPWSQLGLTLLIAVLAGLVASVLPSRSAARNSPVAALSTI